MSYPVALFFADAHVDTHAWVDHPTLRGDSMHAFRHLVDRAIHYKVACVFAAGDLIDVRRPSSEVAEFIRTQMERLECAQIEFHYIQGQHELSSPPWMAALHDWPKHLSEDAVVVDGDHEIYGLDWQPADQLAGKLAEVPESSDVLMAHQVWEDFMGDKAAFEGSFEQVPTETMFTGDFHKLRDMEVTGSKMQKLRVISPGATNMRAMGESSRKYYMLLHDDGSWHRKRIPTRPYGEFDLDNVQMLDAFEKENADYGTGGMNFLHDQIRLSLFLSAV